MKPAFSVLVFTVFSGMGLGALVLLCGLDLAAAATLLPRLLPPYLTVFVAVLALVLVIVGLASSFGHLANPRNAWRAATRWRSSWLSREALVSMALVLFAACYALLWQFAGPVGLRMVVAVLTLAAALATLYCTAMIYASLKPIRQWHTWRVPQNYLLLGLASGALLVVAVVRGAGYPAGAMVSIASALLILAAVAKLEYWRYLATGVGATTIERAIGVDQGVRGQPVPGRASQPKSVMAARLLDAGHSRGTFLTREFMVVSTLRQRALLQGAMWIGAFALPLLWLTVGLARWQGALLAVAACMIGLLAERWLFFADARHTVRLFHGDSRT